MAIDVELEHDVLAHCLRDRSFTARCVPVLTQHAFSSPALAWIWKRLQTNYQATRELPSQAVWVQWLKIDQASDKDDTKTRLRLEVLKRLRQRDPATSSPKTALEEIRSFVRMTSLREGAGALLEHLDGNDLDQAEAAAVKALTDARNADQMTEPVKWGLSARERLAGYLDPGIKMRMPTPIEGLNHALGGGLPPGHVALLTAYTNVGKSTFCADLGFTALMHGEKNQVVIHICTEESRQELEARYDARFTGITRDNLLSGKLSEDEQALFLAKFARREEFIGDRLILHEIGPGGPVETIRVMADQARADHPDAPILLICDSLDHLTAGRRYDNVNQEMAATYWRFWSIVRDPALRPIAGWASANAKQTAEKSKPNARAIGGTFEKPKLASVVVGLAEMPGVAAKLSSSTIPVSVHLSKNRVGKVKTAQFLAEANLGTCQFRQVDGGIDLDRIKAQAGDDGDE